MIMPEAKRQHYLEAMQINVWVPRVQLPYAAMSAFDKQIHTDTTPQIIKKQDIAPIDSATESMITIDDVTPAIQQTVITEPPVVVTTATKDTTEVVTPRFSLQLMQAGNCLLLIELPTGEAFQMRDPAYQLLRNILRAAKLPDSPQWLADVIHWPLFKQASIPQGAKEAQEFLQSFVSTYQEQSPNCNCLWLIGLPAIRFTASLNEENYYQAPIIDGIGKTLIVPSLELLIEAPQHKEPLWHAIRDLIPLWQQ